MTIVNQSTPTFPVHDVPITRPFIWLGRGWSDIRSNPAPSLAYGWLVASMGALVLAYFHHPVYAAATIVAYLFVGPVITAGVCELSRRRDHGEKASFQTSLTGLSVSRRSLCLFAGLLLLLAAVWFALAALLLYMTSGAIAPEITATLWGDVVNQLSRAQLLVYSLALATLAGVVFAVSVVTVPMIVDRHVDVGTAVSTSLRTTVRNWATLMLWALLVVALVVFGFATWMLGMILIVPLLEHATWHAYRDIVEEE
tara:strand:- start:572 stop:1336 length:765 start_codon:yes stop_codon:yes gene_type:complete